MTHFYNVPPEQRTIQQWQAVYRRMFQRAYGGSKCQKPYQGLGNMTRLLEFRIIDLTQCCGAEDRYNASRWLAHSLVGLFLICDRLHIRLDEAMVRKWPGACFYCGKTTNCDCLGRHGPATKSTNPVRRDLLRQSLADCQKMLEQLFGENNRRVGMGRVVEHLAGEVGKLSEAAEAFEGAPNDPILRLAAILEAADVLAWLIAVANLLSIDLSTALVENYYLDRCPDCGLKVCEDSYECFLQGWSGLPYKKYLRLSERTGLY